MSLPYLAGAKDVSFLQNVETGSGALSASYSVGTSGSVPSGKVARVRLTTHLYLVLRSRMGEASLSLPLYTFMVCTVTTVSLYWLYCT